MTDKLLDTKCPCCGLWTPEAVPQQPMTYYALMKCREAAENARREALEGAVEVELWYADNPMIKGGVAKVRGVQGLAAGDYLLVPLKRGDQHDDPADDA